MVQTNYINAANYIREVTLPVLLFLFYCCSPLKSRFPLVVCAGNAWILYLISRKSMLCRFLTLRCIMKLLSTKQPPIILIGSEMIHFLSRY